MQETVFNELNQWNEANEVNLFRYPAWAQVHLEGNLIYNLTSRKQYPIGSIKTNLVITLVNRLNEPGCD